MSCFKKDLRSSLRAIRNRVLREGETFYIVFSAGHRREEFLCEDDAREYALDLASFCVSEPAFISERKRLDGVTVQVRATEVSFEFMEGISA